MGLSMAEFGRRIVARRVLDAKESWDRLEGNDGESSGSEHGGAPYGLLLLDGFFPFDQDASATNGGGDGSSSGCDSSTSNDDGEPQQQQQADEDRIHDDNNTAVLPSSSNYINSIISSSSCGAKMIRDLMNLKADHFRRDLLSNVTLEVAGSLRLTNKSTFRRALMSALREKGYDAGICKSRWGGGGGITPGSYEYIDVVVQYSSSSSSMTERRYIVDPDFASELEIARPTEEYVEVLEELPRVLVGKEEVVRKVLRVVGDAAKRSLRSREMHIPPWRKIKYLYAKWLGPYKRTTNPSANSSITTYYYHSTTASSSSSMAPPISSLSSAGVASAISGGGGGVQYCRIVGFQSSVERLVMSIAARIG